MRHKALIIGGGISGLSAAYYLSQAGLRPVLLERKPRVGGVIQTSVVQGCVLEEGPDGFLGAKPWAMNLIRELGLADQVIGSNDHSRITYILKKGKLIRLPEGLMMMVPTKVMPMVVSPLLGWGAKIRMGLEILRQAERPATGPLRPRFSARSLWPGVHRLSGRAIAGGRLRRRSAPNECEKRAGAIR